MTPENAAKWLSERPEITSVRAATVDFNGVWRGKRLPVAQALKALTEGARMPLSISAVNIWGADVENNPMVFEQGDGDGFARPTGRGILPMEWTPRPTAMIPLEMWQEDGTPSPVDPRQILKQVLERYESAGLTVVCAMELEFYLVDPQSEMPISPRSPVTGRRLSGDAVLSIDEIDHFEGFFADVYDACAAHDISVDAAIAENGAGQFEVNLLHCPDPLKIADDATFFKRFVKGIARKHGLAASFMAKPYIDSAGSGLHLHFSVLDEDGNNIFDNGQDDGTDALRFAVQGLLDAMPESGLIFAPHLNSYRRMAPGAHAPTGVCWGYENRTVAVRIPGGPAKARRIEHRVAGADANPYLVLAAILGAALNGMGAATPPPKPIEGDAYSVDVPQISSDWAQAITLFENGKTNASIYPASFVKIFTMAKREELQTFATRMTAFEISTYLEVV